MLQQNKNYQAPSLFKPENLLREARRQKAIPKDLIPTVCVLDPDGDIVEYLVRKGKAVLNKHWACYHTKMYEFVSGETRVGIIGNAVGASFAVLLAEQMFVSGCRLLLSITSAGIINPPEEGVRFVLIKHALRDEGTSYHYLPPGEEAAIQPSLLDQLHPLAETLGSGVAIADSWTTDAPFRETILAIEYAKNQGITAVEMEASALYAFAKVRNKRVICFAHLTNNMAREGGDFEKGIENGSIDSLELIFRAINALTR